MRTIFLVDDDADDRELFQSAVDSFSSEYLIVEAIDGKEALTLMQQDGFVLPDVIFVDLNMPKVNGLDLLIAIKKLQHLKNIPLYIYTTSNAESDRKRCIAEGATGFLTKHHSYVALCEALKNLLQKQFQ